MVSSIQWLWPMSVVGSGQWLVESSEQQSVKTITMTVDTGTRTLDAVDIVHWELSSVKCSV